MTSTPPNWSDSNLRGRSFQGKNLTGANFQGADVRGCNFSHANLENANFTQARMGLAPGALLWGCVLLGGTGAIAFHVLGQLMFGIFGLSSVHPNYGLRVALISILATVGGLVGLTTYVSWRWPRLMVAGLEGAVLGFFCGGLFSDLSLTSAIVGSLIGGVILGVGSYFGESKGIGVVIATLGVAMTNGMFFIAGTNMLQLWVVNQTLAAFLWLGISLLYGWITLRAIWYLYHELRRMGWTSFDGANLNQVRWK